jgi:hypothetical protein
MTRPLGPSVVSESLNTTTSHLPISFFSSFTVTVATRPVAHVLPYPPPPHVNSFVLGPAVINTHGPVGDLRPGRVQLPAIGCVAM